jgi:asparagine synthase (glutamine-hydrolysing)
MCGLSGFLDFERRGEAGALGRIIAGMASTLRHRGPDSHDFWVDASAGLAFGHRRLAIVDLSPEGRQPMKSADDRFVITYNGEIYNFQALRQELAEIGWSFRGHSDTEVLLALIQSFGLEAALQRAAGMFAFALWDRATHQLHLVRDRLGKKPLYFGWIGEAFVFASELKALAAHPDFAPDVDRAALTAYFRHQYIPAPWSIWRGVYKLPPGCRLSLGVGELAKTRGDALLARIAPYWSAKAMAERGVAEPRDLPPEAALDGLETALRQAVRERMAVDVPFGAFLSGGVDSSLVVALMQQESSQPIKTFTIGFEEQFFDEAPAARAVAEHLGTDHTEFFVTSAEAQAAIPQLPQLYDEPFADPSAVPTFHVARLARQSVTVCLSGDGGDEVFAGYGRYALAANLGRRLSKVPLPLRRAAGRAITAIPASGWDAALRLIGSPAVTGLRGASSGDRMHKLAALLDARNQDELYHALVSVVRAPTSFVRGGAERPTVFDDPAELPAFADSVRRMMYCDTVSYLPDDVLAKVDRASMAVSLEVRAPLLDHAVVELSWRLPQSMKVRGACGKRILREVLYRRVPKRLIERPKMGFSVPIDAWLRGPLRNWARDLLFADSGRGWFDRDAITAAWRDLCEGRPRAGTAVWAAVMLQAWRARWLH